MKALQKSELKFATKLLLKVKNFAVSKFLTEDRYLVAMLLLWFVLSSQFSLVRAFDMRSCFSALSVCLCLWSVCVGFLRVCVRQKVKRG